MKNNSKLSTRKSSNSNHYLSILTNLVFKYTHQFCFYFKKPITEAIYFCSKSAESIQISDTLIFSDDQQCLNRMYHYYNALGKEQIYERIRRIGRCYEEGITPTKYPLMIMTNTSKIFKARQRRLKKMVASNCSSDESEQTQLKDISFESEGFLKSISKPESSFSMEIEEINGDQNQLSFDQESHTIYADTPHIHEVIPIKLKSKELQKSISNLICDFNDIDIDKTLADYHRISHLKKTNQKQLSLKISSQLPSQPSPQYPYSARSTKLPSEQSNKYHKQNHKQPIVQKYHRKKSTHQHQKKLSLLNQANNYQQYKKQRNKITIQNVQNVRFMKVNSNTERLNQQNCQEKYRKQIIREKAMRLLNRVQSQIYIHDKNDYNEL